MSRRICKRRKDQVWTNPTVVLYTLSRFAYPISLRRSRLDRRAPAGQYSRYERDGETTIFILRVPIHDAEAEVTYSTTSLRSNELLIEKTSKSRFAKLGETEEDLLEDVVTEQKHPERDDGRIRRVHRGIAGTLPPGYDIRREEQDLPVDVLLPYVAAGEGREYNDDQEGGSP